MSIDYSHNKRSKEICRGAHPASNCGYRSVDLNLVVSRPASQLRLLLHGFTSNTINAIDAPTATWNTYSVLHRFFTSRTALEARSQMVRLLSATANMNQFEPLFPQEPHQDQEPHRDKLSTCKDQPKACYGSYTFPHCTPYIYLGDLYVSWSWFCHTNIL